MQRIFTKSVGLSILVGIFLLACSLPVFTDSVQAKTNDTHSGSSQENHAIPQTSTYPTPPCMSINVTLLPNRLTPDTIFYLAWHPASQILEPSYNHVDTFPRNLAQESSPFDTEYRCRNSLNSEEPPQV